MLISGLRCRRRGKDTEENTNDTEGTT